MSKSENLNRPHPTNTGKQPKNDTNGVNDFIQNVQSLSDLRDADIFHPKKGYGAKIANALKLSHVQLRKVYHEFLQIAKLAEADKIDEAMARLYRLYAIVEYQANREVINERFRDFLHRLFDLIEGAEKPEDRKKSIHKAKDLLMSIVAYSKGRR